MNLEDRVTELERRLAEVEAKLQKKAQRRSSTVRRVNLSPERQAIVDVLDNDTPRSPNEIAARLNKSSESIRFLLGRLERNGLVRRAAYGRYVRAG